MLWRRHCVSICNLEDLIINMNQIMMRSFLTGLLKSASHWYLAGQVYFMAILTIYPSALHPTVWVSIINGRIGFISRLINLRCCKGIMQLSQVRCFSVLVFLGVLQLQIQAIVWGISGALLSRIHNLTNIFIIFIWR